MYNVHVGLLEYIHVHAHVLKGLLAIIILSILLHLIYNVIGIICNVYNISPLIHKMYTYMELQSSYPATYTCTLYVILLVYKLYMQCT